LISGFKFKTIQNVLETTIEVVDGPPCISHVKTPWLFSLFKLQEKDFMTNYSSEKVYMIEVLGDLKDFWYFPLESNWETCWIQ